MGGVNRVFLIGNLGAKPETKFLPSGQSVTELRLAVGEKWKDKNGEAQERTEWVSVVVWGKAGENCTQYLDKGRQVCVEGRMQTRSWDDKTTGEKRYKTEVVSTQVTFIGGGKGANNYTPEDTSLSETPGQDKSNATPPVDDDSIPF